MNVLLIGGAGGLMNHLILKMKKEGHRVYLLTGSRLEETSYQKVFEKYNFSYESASLPEIFESIQPDLTIFAGACDTNFTWKKEEPEAVRYMAALTNILMGYVSRGSGRFVYISSEEVYGGDYPEDITEQAPPSPQRTKGMILAQGEEMCESCQKSTGRDILILRLDHLYVIPRNRREIRDICSRMCLEALEQGRILVPENDSFSLLYVTDAVELICRAAVSREHKRVLYNISSQTEISRMELAGMIQRAMGEDGTAVIPKEGEKRRAVLSRALYESEFGSSFFCEVSVIVEKTAAQMKKNSYLFRTEAQRKPPLLERMKEKGGSLLKTLLPFVENLIAFIPFFMLNNRAVGSGYFSSLDFYLLYVLLFAIVYGQQQAMLSAVLAVAGYCFRQMYDRSGFDVLIDTNTYAWIAQLFILGLTVGYMRDQILRLKEESEQEKDFLTLQLTDIQDINSSNVRVKDALETQIVNQSDSVGKIYSITSALEHYSPEEVLFYAAEMLGRLLKSRDVAIYTVSNKAYARLFSATSKKARMLGYSIQYTQMGELYETLAAGKVFINRKMDERYPLMASAICENDEMQMILMVWDIPWERMTLGQANQLVVISALIQNAVLRAGRYLAALEHQRYVDGTPLLGTDAFTALVQAYVKAQKRGLTECTLLKIESGVEDQKETALLIAGSLRQSDYVGTMPDGGLYVLLSNTNRENAQFVIKRFEELGLRLCIAEEAEA